MRTLNFLFALLITVSIPAFGSGGGGEAAAPAAETSKEDREYREKSAKLSGLEAKITDLNGQLTKLIENKRKEKDPEKARPMMDQLVTLTKDRNTAVVDHLRLKNELLYRFPNMGETIHQKYGTHQEATVDQLEKAQGLDELLNQTKQMIVEKYKPILKDLPEVKAEQTEKNYQQKKDQKKDEEKAEPLRLVK